MLSLLQFLKIKNFLSKDTSKSENGIQPISNKKTFADTNQKKNLIKNWTKTHHGWGGREKDIPTAIVCLTLRKCSEPFISREAGDIYKILELRHELPRTPYFLEAIWKW